MRRFAALVVVVLAAACSKFGSEGSPAAEETDAGTPSADGAISDAAPTPDGGEEQDAAPVTDPSFLGGKKIVFITADMTDGDLGLGPIVDPANESNICDRAATRAVEQKIGVLAGHGPFRVVLERAGRLDAFGQLLGSTPPMWFALTGQLAFDALPTITKGPMTIITTEYNAVLGPNEVVWTGALAGAMRFDCDDWTNSALTGTGTVGSATASDSTWWALSTHGCQPGTAPHLYCFEVDKP